MATVCSRSLRMAGGLGLGHPRAPAELVLGRFCGPCRQTVPPHRLEGGTALLAGGPVPAWRATWREHNEPIGPQSSGMSETAAATRKLVPEGIEGRRAGSGAGPCDYHH